MKQRISEGLEARILRAQTKNRARSTVTKVGTPHRRSLVARDVVIPSVVAQIPVMSEQEIVAQSLPGGCGVYFLIREGRVIYIGQSVNVAARVAGHVWSGKSLTGRRRTAKRIVFDAWTWLPFEERHLDVMERAYINAFHPKMNTDTRTEAYRRVARASRPETRGTSSNRT